jgi:ubiquinone/menaquinone biosynthesis C-methylase UbiE
MILLLSDLAIAFTRKTTIMTKNYGEVYAPIYDDLFRNRDDLALVASALARFATNGSALEFGIGTGRIAIPLSQCGVTVAGIDISQAMLDKLSAKPEAKNIRFRIGDCTQDTFEGDFSLVYIVFSTLFLVGAQDMQVMCFQNAARHLPIGGTFVVEGFVHDRTRCTNNQ